jgi:uncharacterized membrane protein YfcA
MIPMLLLFGAGLLGGAMNALAGGGTFATLPAMIASGVPSVQANASCTVALLPGGFAGAWAFRKGLAPVCGVPLPRLLAVTLVGGVCGAFLLLSTPTTLFDAVLPWLLLVAAVTLAFGAQLRALLERSVRIGGTTILAAQFMLGIYGGYFGGAVGLMMMAAWTLFGQRDLKAMSAPRTLMVSATNTMAALTFILAHAVYWPQTVAMLIGSTVGGYGGARLSSLAPAWLVRAVTLLVVWGITAGFFLKTYAR